jgi:hypothetical protein
MPSDYSVEAAGSQGKSSVVDLIKRDSYWGTVGSFIT